MKIPIKQYPVYDPQEVIAVPLTMTRDQALAFVDYLESYEADNNTSAYWWRHCCDDKRMGAETAARYEQAAARLKEIRELIEKAIGAGDKEE